MFHGRVHASCHLSFALILFLGAPLAAASQPDPAEQVAVRTPCGLVPRSQVHLVGTGQVVEVHADHIDLVNHDGSIASRATPGPGPARLPALGTGWIIDTEWHNGSAHAIRQFQSTWVVPPAPLAWNNQLIYLFEGMTNAQHILQPVLQYGSEVDGGGAFWSVASWYVSSSGAVYVTPAVAVGVGAGLAGEISWLSRDGDAFSYLCQFANVPGTALQVNRIGELTTCYETLEAYGLVQADDYPDTSGTEFFNILIRLSDGYPKMAWTPQDRVTDLGQHAVVLSNSSTDGSVLLDYGSSSQQVAN